MSSELQARNLFITDAAPAIAVHMVVENRSLLQALHRCDGYLPAAMFAMAIAGETEGSQKFGLVSVKAISDVTIITCSVLARALRGTLTAVEFPQSQYENNEDQRRGARERLGRCLT
jgi:hypothetical protein